MMTFFCFLFCLTEWSGINALLYYGPTLVHSIGLRGDTVTLLVSGGIGVVQFLAVLPAIVCIDRLGKKPWTPFFLIFVIEFWSIIRQETPSSR